MAQLGTEWRRRRAAAPATPAPRPVVQGGGERMAPPGAAWRRRRAATAASPSRHPGKRGETGPARGGVEEEARGCDCHASVWSSREDGTVGPHRGPARRGGTIPQEPLQPTVRSGEEDGPAGVRPSIQEGGERLAPPGAAWRRRRAAPSAVVARSRSETRGRKKTSRSSRRRRTRETAAERRGDAGGGAGICLRPGAGANGGRRQGASSPLHAPDERPRRCGRARPQWAPPPHRGAPRGVSEFGNPMVNV